MNNDLQKKEIDNSLQVFGSQANFEQAQRMATALSKSTLIPKEYQNNIPNCIIALEMANRMGASAFMVMQNLDIIVGRPSWSSKFLIASVNGCGKFSPLRYEFKGTENTDEWSCRAYAKDKSGETLKGSWVSIKMAKDEGWFGKNGSKWKTMPELMLQYRSAAFFQRTYAPELSMGLISAEEAMDIQQNTVDVEYTEVERETAQIKEVLDTIITEDELNDMLENSTIELFSEAEMALIEEKREQLKKK